MFIFEKLPIYIGLFNSEILKKKGNQKNSVYSTTKKKIGYKKQIFNITLNIY